MLSGDTQVAAVIGHPVRHSLSPAIHNAAFAALGLDWAFVAFDVAAGATTAGIDAVRVLGLAVIQGHIGRQAEATHPLRQPQLFGEDRELLLNREFQAHELKAEDKVDPQEGGADSNWRVLRARNKWQEPADCAHHPFPGSYPVVVTDKADWGGWRVPGAEYDRDPERIEFQSRLIAASPELLDLARDLVEAVAEAPDDAPPESVRLARRAREILLQVTEVLAPPPEPVRTMETTQAA